MSGNRDGAAVGNVQQNRVLDWTPRFDERSLTYKVSKGTPELKNRSRVWKRTIWLDQGSEGACVGFSGAQLMSTTPRRFQPPYTDEDARALYHEAQKNDQWPGENYEGSSVLGGMQALKGEGRVKRYEWCTTIEEVLHAISYIGPLQIGINWYQGMWNPDINGMLNVTGKKVGGHAIVIGGNDTERQRVLLYNSWGKGWGLNGSGWVSYDDLDRLLGEDGEFAVPTKVKPA